MKQYIIKLSFNNPKPTVRYLGEMNNCNTPKAKAKRFSMEEAEEAAKSFVLDRLNPTIVEV